MTDTELNELVATVERVLIEYDIHLTTDRYNGLYEYLHNLVESIKENGE